MVSAHASMVSGQVMELCIVQDNGEYE